MIRVIGLVAAALLNVANSAAQSATASGRFQTEKTTIEIKGAYSFWYRSASPASSESVIRIAVGNGSIDPDYFDRFLDRLRALNARFVDEEYRLAYFEFTPDGKYHGLSYYFGPGDGCGYCYDPDVRSTVRLSQGRLRGHIGFREKKRSFEVDLDVPVPEKTWGTPLPPGGGDVGKVYLAYDAALRRRDVKAGLPLIDARTKEFWQKLEKEGKLGNYLDYCWKEKHLEMKSPEVTGGFLHGDRAVLLIKGEGVTALHGEALLRRENGAWRFSDELFEPE